MSAPVDPVEAIAQAVLYEGYILYPYSASSTKNQVRWTFGGVFPRSYAEANEGESSVLQAQCLLRFEPGCTVDTSIRFLRLVQRTVGRLGSPVTDLQPDSYPDLQPADSVVVAGETYSSWQEAVEHRVEVGGREIQGLLLANRKLPVDLPAQRTVEPLGESDGTIGAAIVRESQALRGEVEVSAEVVAPKTARLSVRFENLTPLGEPLGMRREQAAMHAFISSHVVLRASGGQFVSQADPPDGLRPEAEACRNLGVWPVLVGAEGATDTVLASPIILEDHPAIAPESPGDLFDGTEIDEILTLRILTLTDEEKAQMRQADPRTRAMLERSESLTADELLNLHGALRGVRSLAERDE
ncbi:MAG: hypothetical protein M3072_00750 [Candidatus Dormibacteraeota bacterium]|nr:hypothetical protein [Candidatus Dormibacteraeota bacterium]